jgi:hypothetical protein
VEAADPPAENASSESRGESPDPVAVEESEEGSEGESDRSERPREIGGPKGLEPTRYGDWEKGGRCIDF